MARDKTAEDRKAGARHESAAKTHERAARFWDGQGDMRRAALQRRMAEYERQGAQLERSWARLTDPDSPQTEIQSADEVRRHTRTGAGQAVEHLMQLAETLETSARLAEEHARRRERTGNSHQGGVEYAAAKRAHDAARRARSQAEEWRKLLTEET